MKRYLRPIAVIAAAWVALGAMRWGLWLLQHADASGAVRAGARAVFATRPFLWLLFTGIIWLAARRADLRRSLTVPVVALHATLALGLAALDAAWYGYAWARFGAEQVDLPFLGYYGSLVNGSVYLYAVILGCVYGADWYTQRTAGNLRKSRLRSSLIAAQLHALTVQLHPHFLFNALNSVSELVHRSPAQASAMILHLRELLHDSLRTAPRGMVSLREELAFLQHYIELQQTRFGGLAVEVHAQPEALECAVPHFLMQPLVENAIRHGIAPAGGAGRIEIHAAVTRGKLRIRVTDDGVGPGAKLREGIGLRNVRERIEHLYGGSGSFALAPLPNGGACATVEFTATAFNPEAHTAEPETAGISEPIAPPGKPRLWRITFTAASILFAVSVVKELVIFEITAQPWEVARHWLVVDLFAAYAWAPSGVLVAYAAYRVAAAERRGRWVMAVIGLLILLPGVLLLVRAHFRLVYSPSYELWSTRSIYWITQDLTIFLVVAAIAFAGGIYRDWRETELSAAQLLQELNQSRLTLLSQRVQPGLLVMLDRLAQVTQRAPERTDYLTGKMGELLRFMLEQDHLDNIDVAEEVVFLETLLEIEAGLELRPLVHIRGVQEIDGWRVKPRAIQRGLAAFEMDAGTRVQTIVLTGQRGRLAVTYEGNGISRRVLLDAHEVAKARTEQPA